jgi:hypothetical protein
MTRNTTSLLVTLVLGAAFLSGACASKKTVEFSRGQIPRNASVAVVIDAPNNLKNVVLAGFLKKGINAKAFNATDLYSLSDVFDITDLKKVSYAGDADKSLIAMEKAYDNIYKLHVYNYEINKAELLEQMKNKWNVQYLVILDLKDWEQVSWARAINLATMDIVWLKNHPTAYSDTVESIVEMFIESMTGK